MLVQKPSTVSTTRRGVRNDASALTSKLGTTSEQRVTKLEQGTIVAAANPISRPDLKLIQVDIAKKTSEISHIPLDFSYLIYGPKKIGKTDFSSMFGGNRQSTYFFMYEKWADHLQLRQTLMDDTYDEDGKLEIPAWLKGEAYLESLITNPGDVKVICFDGLKAGYDKAFSQGCREGGFLILPYKVKVV